jgi:hypothetical protein
MNEYPPRPEGAEDGGPPFLGSGGFMAMWKKVAIVVVARITSVLVYVEFFKAR